VDVEATLVQATSLEPRLTIAQMELALLYESHKTFDKAIERYRQILTVQPDDAGALNNLAYDLAEHAGNAKEALPLAERAYRLSSQAPVMTDTLGWVHHLAGDNLTAAAYLEQALRELPGNPDVILHVATVYAALGDLPRARTQLAAAAKLGPSVTDRDDFKALQAKLLKQ
jgi:Tfp pilus assembly protein PilF